MRKGEPIVVVKYVSKSYGKVEALKEVSLVVEQGEIFGLIGPDGAGKSTLFRILTTLLLADKGSATVGGLNVVEDYELIRTKVGYMPGRFSLYQDLSVEENLEFFATVFHTTIQENYALIKDIYQQIEPFKKRRAGALSGGMKQKLALSCALIHKPDILFLDEPTTGVDPVSRKEFWQMLRNLREQGITIIVSTPIMDEARQCDRIAFINHGEIHGIDTPERILQEFASILCPPSLEREEVQHTMAPVIEVEQLTKCFGNFTAVDHISFQVNRGEIFGFLGANGAGKTTAMRMLCGLSKPTSGVGKVAGFDISREAEQVKKHIGYMSQKFSLYEDLKVWENIRLFAGIYGMKEKDIEQKTDELLERLGFSAERNTLVKSLPLGWKQKLAFSVSIFHEPRIVFLDEPTGGVDPATRRQFWELIYQAADRGITVFVLDVPVVGSLFWLVVVSLLFIFVSLSLGLLISSVTRTQVAAMLASGMILMMPTMVLSSMIFPVESMPLILQLISDIIPARWYIQAVRKLMIEGVSVVLVFKEIGILLLMATVLITVSIKKFKYRLE